MGFFNKKSEKKSLGERLNGKEDKLFYKFISPHLQKDEEIESYVANTVNRVSYGLNSIPSVYIVATNKRIIFFQQTGITKSKIKSIPYTEIKSIEMEAGLVFSEVDFRSTNNDFSVDKISALKAKEFVELIESKRNK